MSRVTTAVNPAQARMDFRPAGMRDTRDLSVRYREASTVGWPGACPIESGLLGSLADHECPHGSLPSDTTIACGCW